MIKIMGYHTIQTVNSTRVDADGVDLSADIH